jgi:hypothetical protein
MRTMEQDNVKKFNCAKNRKNSPSNNYCKEKEEIVVWLILNR